MSASYTHYRNYSEAIRAGSPIVEVLTNSAAMSFCEEHDLFSRDVFSRQPRLLDHGDVVKTDDGRIVEIMDRWRLWVFSSESEWRKYRKPLTCDQYLYQ